MIPVLEVKFAIPFGAAYGLPFWPNFFTALAGAIIPMPFIILFMRRVIAWARKIRFFRPVAEFVDKHAVKKSKKVNPKFIQLGIFLFVAIPLPGTGVWTGSMISSVLDLRIKTVIVPIALGHIVASVAIALLSHWII